MLNGLLGKSRKQETNRVRRGHRNSILQVRARQSENRRARARIWARVLAAFGAAGLLLWVGMTGSRGIARSLYRDNPRYTIRVLDIEASERMSDMIRRFGGVSVGMNLFDVDLQALRENLLGLPIVQSVRVERRLPDTLVVRVSERIPMARIWIEGSPVDLGVDREGMVLGPTYALPHLPRIEATRAGSLIPGNRIERADLLAALELLDLCDTTRIGQIVKINRIRVSEEDVMTLHLAAGDQVLFPRRQIEAKLLGLAGILKTIQDQRMREDGKPFHIDMTTEKNVPVYRLAE